jgi:WD40 repeat protein
LGTGKALNSNEVLCIATTHHTNATSTSTTGHKVATGWKDGSIRVFEVGQDDMKSFQGQGQSKLGLVQSLLFPRGGEEEEFIMREPLVLNGHSGSPITALAFHFEGMNTTLASGSSDGTVILWDIINGELN